jgi:hypothetical protein
MKLTQYDLERALKILPNYVQSTMVTHGTVVAGGFLRCVVTKEHVKDIDLFSTSPEKALESARYLCDVNLDPTRIARYSEISTSKNAYSIKNVGGFFVQFVHRWSYPDPEKLLKSFDFTIAKAAMWYDTSIGWTSLVDENFYPDVAARRLNYSFPDRKEDASGSLLRVLKFIKKGYNIPNDSLAGVVARVARHAENIETKTANPYEALAAPYGDELESLQEKKWTRIIHSSIAAVTGES